MTFITEVILLVVELKFKEGFSCYSWYWYSSDDSSVLSGIRDATLTWTVFYFLLHPLLFECFLIFDCFLIGFSFEFRQFIKTIRICFFGNMLAMFDLAWISLPGSNVKHDWKLYLCLKFLFLWIWFCMCIALVCRCLLWACWDVAEHKE